MGKHKVVAGHHGLVSEVLCLSLGTTIFHYVTADGKVLRLTTFVFVFGFWFSSFGLVFALFVFRQRKGPCPPLEREFEKGIADFNILRFRILPLVEALVFLAGIQVRRRGDVSALDDQLLLVLLDSLNRLHHS